VRGRLLLGAVVGALALPAGAHAATIEISGLDEGGQRFSPADSAGQTGDTVTWGFAAAVAPHNVNLVPPGVDPANTAAHELLGFAFPGQGQTFTKVLDQPGVYLYYCNLHGGLAPGGMNGRVVIGAPGDPPPPPLPTGPAPQPNTVAFSGPFEAGDTTPPSLGRVGALSAGRSVRLRFELGERATVTVRLLRTSRPARTAVFKDRGAGVGTVAVKRVKPGRYAVRVKATDAAGLASAPVTRKVVVRR
jgi:plastocyanin